MKKLVLFFLLSVFLNIKATTYTAIGTSTFTGFNGSCPFFNGGTRLTVQPSTGDVLVIPVACTVSLSGNISVTNAITLDIYGQLSFPTSGDKVDFHDATVINVYTGGSLYGVSNSNQIRVGSGAADWSGPGLFPGPFSIKNTGITPLPITLIDFSATCETNGIKLIWKTATELNNDHFILEKSKDVKNWELVAEIKGAGTTSDIKNYVYLDYLVNSNLTYYRLTQVDFNGAKELFKAIDISCEEKGKNEMILFPNPSSTELNIILNVTKPVVNGFIKLIDNLGNVILQYKVNLDQGVNTFNYPLDAKQGSYGIVFIADNLVIPSQKLLVTSTNL